VESTFPPPFFYVYVNKREYQEGWEACRKIQDKWHEEQEKQLAEAAAKRKAAQEQKDAQDLEFVNEEAEKQ